MFKRIDFHTHLYPPSWIALREQGLVSILDYHYLHAELYRVVEISPGKFLDKSKKERAEIIWDKLIRSSSEIQSTSVKGVLFILDILGVSARLDFLSALARFEEIVQKPDYDQRIFSLAGLDAVVMTNDIFDQHELEMMSIPYDQNRYIASFRLDKAFENETFQMSLKYSQTIHRIDSNKSLVEYLEIMIRNNRPIYVALSLCNSQLGNKWFKERLEAIINFCGTNSIGLSLMCGVQRGINPTIGLAGDGEENFDFRPLYSYLNRYVDVKLFVTVLNLHDQFSLCVLARKFCNVTPFGVWWFQNHVPQITYITQLRVNMLGDTFIPQHSDARVLEQLLYKWNDSRIAMRKLDSVPNNIEKFLFDIKKYL